MSGSPHHQHISLATVLLWYFEQRKTHLAGKKHRAILQQASSSCEKPEVKRCRQQWNLFIDMTIRLVNSSRGHSRR